ncbi:MAG: beta-RFAP synthase [Planctomycetia bacterium]|nr:beta-RFAP synthase [Planctomycetia bacterium]
MTRVIAGSRLHFGLLSLHGTRRFGGVGVMIDMPRLVVSAMPASQWSATGPLATRALEFARPLAEPHRLMIEEAPPEHSGFGTGTQLALAVGRAVSSLSLEEIARQTGRARRSAIGTHGFASGGLLVDGGRREGIAPLIVRYEIPKNWRIVVAMPDAPQGLSGGGEAGAFSKLPGDCALTDKLCRLTLLGMLPALVEGNLADFAAALGEFNARSGELFAPIQGGAYCVGVVSELIARMRSLGVEGVGQSSWGPAAFAVVEADKAEWLRERIAAYLGPTGRTWLTTARNVGAEVSMD